MIELRFDRYLTANGKAIRSLTDDVIRLYSNDGDKHYGTLFMNIILYVDLKEYFMYHTKKNVLSRIICFSAICSNQIGVSKKYIFWSNFTIQMEAVAVTRLGISPC